MSSFAEAVDLKKVPLRPTYGKPKSVTIIVIRIMLALCLRKGFIIPVHSVKSKKYHIGWENVEDGVFSTLCIPPSSKKSMIGDMRTSSLLGQ